MYIRWPIRKLRANGRHIYYVRIRIGHVMQRLLHFEPGAMESANNDVVEGLGETLNQFVSEWRRELETSTSAETLLGKRGAKREEKRSVCGGDEELVQVPVEKRVNVVPVREPSPLLVLPACREERRRSVPLRREADGGTQSPSLLDTLLSDLVGQRYGQG